MWFAALAAVALSAPSLERPLVTGSGLATEGGPGTGWVNPANLAYDPDTSWGVFVDQAWSDATSIAVAAGTRHLWGGVQNLRHPGGTADWSIDAAVGIPLPRRLAIGAMGRWRLEEAADNFVSFDLGASWRPLTWLGFSAVTRNLGNPDRSGDDPASAGVGLAIRPGRVLTLGVDWRQVFAENVPGEIVATARVRPSRGWYLRAAASTTGWFGGGVEVYFGGVGAVATATGSATGELALGGWLGSDEPEESVVMPRRRVGAWTLDHRSPEAPAEGLLEAPEPAWLERLTRFREASVDRRLEGLVVTLDDADLGAARFEELRRAIMAARAAGTRVVVVLHGSPGNGAYHAASSADEIILHPASILDLVGVRLAVTTAGEALDAIGVEAEVARRSEYKAAPEMFTEDRPSVKNLAQLEVLADDRHARLVIGIAEGRGVTEEAARTWIDGGPYSAEEALAAGLVDRLAYADEVESALDASFGHAVEVIPFDGLARGRSPWESPRQIAIVPITGTIDHGRSRDGLLGQTSGAATIVAQLAAARTDDSIKAVVLRVDSPGGSALGSEEIWRGVERLRTAGKPVVVSMADVAASGGYFVAAPANRIFALPMTVTGSIGVFQTHFAFGRALDRLGVHTTEITRGAHAGIDGSDRPWTPEERGRQEELVDEVYSRFKERVGRGRDLDAEQVEAVARGRIWSGQRAAEVGLVDELGGIEDAAAAARELANIPERARVDFVWYRDRRGLLGELASSLIGDLGLKGALRPLPTGVAAALAPRSEAIRAELPWTLELDPR